MNESNPRVSVLMAVFNTGDYLLEALQSIGNQNFIDFEFIAVDDGSTDGSTQILRDFAAHEPRFRLVTRENRGLIFTRNELLNAARGELVAWMDSDDVSSPDRLELQVSYFDAHPDTLCLGGMAQCIDPEGNFLNMERYPLLHSEILVDQQKGGAMRFPTTMMRRDAAIRAGGFREPFKIGEDFDLLLRLSEQGTMANIPSTIYLYRQHLKSVCANLGPKWASYRDTILALALQRKQFGIDKLQRGEEVTIPETGAVNMKPFESRTYMRWAQAAQQNSNTKLARKYALAAITAQPTSRQAWKNLIKIFARKK